jgi:HK97 family phage prohead protease
MQTSSVQYLDLKATEQGIVEGYASVWNVLDSHGDVVIKGAFQNSLNTNTPVVMLWSHSQAQPVGKWLDIREDDKGLFVRGQLNLNTQAGRDAFEHLKAGDISAFSIGYMVNPNGSEIKNGVNYLRDLELAEISLVSLPSNTQARVTSVKHLNSAKPQTLREFETLLREAGNFSRKEAADISQKGFWVKADKEEISRLANRIAKLANNF